MSASDSAGSFAELLGTLRSPFFLAPLAGFSDSAFRYICSMHGAALCYTEMLSAKGLYYGSPGSEAILKRREGEAPLVIQLFGSEPEMMSFAAGRLKDLPNVAIDINMGCPVPKVVKNGEGSALLNDPALAAECVSAAAETAGKPVTVKMRRSFTDKGIVAANQATKDAAAMANGFTGIMGYASTIVSGIGIAFIKEHFGWDVTLGAIAFFAIVGMVLFLFAWNAAADGYRRRG